MNVNDYNTSSSDPMHLSQANPSTSENKKSKEKKDRKSLPLPKPTPPSSRELKTPVSEGEARVSDQTSQEPSLFDTLPQENLAHIFSFLDKDDAEQTASVSQNWKETTVYSENRKNKHQMQKVISFFLDNIDKEKHPKIVKNIQNLQDRITQFTPNSLKEIQTFNKEVENQLIDIIVISSDKFSNLHQLSLTTKDSNRFVDLPKLAEIISLINQLNKDSNSPNAEQLSYNIFKKLVDIDKIGTAIDFATKKTTEKKSRNRALHHFYDLAKERNDFDAAFVAAKHYTGKHSVLDAAFVVVKQYVGKHGLVPELCEYILTQVSMDYVDNINESLKKAINFAEEIDDPHILSDLYYRIKNQIEMSNLDYDIKNELILSLLPLSQKIYGNNHDVVLELSHALLVQLNLGMESNDKIIEYLKMAINFSEEIDDPNVLSSLYYNIKYIIEKLDNNVQNELLLSLLPLSEKVNGNNYDAVDVYCRLKDFDKAMDVAKNISDVRVQSNMMLKVCENASNYDVDKALALFNEWPSSIQEKAKAEAAVKIAYNLISGTGDVAGTMKFANRINPNIFYSKKDFESFTFQTFAEVAAYLLKKTSDVNSAVKKVNEISNKITKPYLLYHLYLKLRKSDRFEEAEKLASHELKDFR